MKEKLKIKAIIIFIPIILIGATYLVNSYLKKDITSLNNKCVIVSDKVLENQNVDDKPIKIVQKWESKNIKGLNQILGFVSEDEVLVGIGLTKDEFIKKYKGKKLDAIGPKESIKLDNSMYGELYVLNLKTLKKTPLNLGKISSNSEQNNGRLNVVKGGLCVDDKKIDYCNKDNQYLYDINKKNIVNYGKRMSTKWSENGKYLIGCKEVYRNYYDLGEVEKGQKRLYIYDVKNKITKIVGINSNIISISYNCVLYSKNGKDIYFVGEKNKKEKRREGIFKINVENKKIKEIMLLPYGIEEDFELKNSIYDFIKKDKTIIFSGTIQGKNSIYSYDINSKKIQNSISTPNIEDKRSKYIISNRFCISPDKTKIAYISKTKENIDTDKWNIYISRINGDRLTNKILVKKNIYIGDTASYRKLKLMNWSADSKSIIYFTYDSQIKKNGYRLTEGSKINIVRFK